jgi:hypothetical protein
MREKLQDEFSRMIYAVIRGSRETRSKIFIRCRSRGFLRDFAEHMDSRPGDRTKSARLSRGC